jgi:superfamily I DNA and/or RNA helicase
MPPSAIFYNDSLEPKAFANGRIHWPELPKPYLPLKFIGTTTNDESNDERASWFNLGEIDKVVEIIKSLLANGDQCQPPLNPAEIGVMAPWREQVWRLRLRLRKENLNAVDVGTIEVGLPS